MAARVRRGRTVRTLRLKFLKAGVPGPAAAHRFGAQTDLKKLKVNKGAIVLVLGQDRKKVRSVIFAALNGGAVAAMSGATVDHKAWDQAHEWPKPRSGSKARRAAWAWKIFGDVLLLSETALAALKDVPDGTVFSLASELGESERSFTWNAVERLRARMLERGLSC